MRLMVFVSDSFVDGGGFTTFSENHRPERGLIQLNSSFLELPTVVHRHQVELGK